MSPKGERTGRGRTEVSGGTGKDEVAEFTFLDTVRTVMGRVWCRKYGHANGEADTLI